MLALVFVRNRSKFIAGLEFKLKKLLVNFHAVRNACVFSFLLVVIGVVPA